MVKCLKNHKTFRNNNDDINEFSNPTLWLCHYFISSRNMVLGSNLPYLFVQCHSFDHRAYQPSSLSTIEPIDHRPHQPSSLSTIESINLWSSFETFKLLGLFFKASCSQKFGPGFVLTRLFQRETGPFGQITLNINTLMYQVSVMRDAFKKMIAQKWTLAHTGRGGNNSNCSIIIIFLGQYFFWMHP